MTHFTNPIETNNPTAGEVTQYRKTLVKRGQAVMTMSGVTGSVTVDLKEYFLNAGNGLIPTIEVARWTSGGGTTTSIPLPYVVNSTTTVTTNGYFYLNTYVTPGVGNQLDLVIQYYQAGAVLGDLKYFYYRLYSEAAMPVSGTASDYTYPQLT